MPDLRPKELIHAEELIYNGKPDKAFEIVVNFEKNRGITPKEQLWVLLLKGWILSTKQQGKQTVEIGELAYQLSQKLGTVPESIDALLLKAHIEDTDKSFKLISRAKELFYSLPEEILYADKDDLLLNILMQEATIYFSMGDLNASTEKTLKSLELAEKLEHKISNAYLLMQLHQTYLWRSEHDASLDYAMKSLNLMEEMGFQMGIASSLSAIAAAFYPKGELNKVLEFCQKSLSIQQISKRTKVTALQFVGVSYIHKGELDLALDNLLGALRLAEEISSDSQILAILNGIGSIQVMKRNYDQATISFNRCLTLSHKTGILIHSFYANHHLFFINLEKGFEKKAVHYLENLKKLTEKTPQQNTMYLHAKALLLIKKGRSRDRAEAEKLLKEIVDGAVEGISLPGLYIASLVTLCDFLLKELNESNDQEILKELTPLIQRLLESAENQNSFWYLAEGKLLQAKLALIGMNIEQAKLLLTQAQDIAEGNGLQLLARAISKEYDNLLEQIEEWQALKRRKAKMSDRIKLASIDDVIARLQGTRALKPPELVDEEPVLLLIIAEGGIPVFSNLFTEKFSVEDGFISNFLTAFNTFSETVFSKGLDRAKFGEYILIMDSIGSFKVCYLFKGQSYAAKQKLIQLAHRVQNTASIWRAFEDFHTTHQSILLKKNPQLESLITEIFIKKDALKSQSQY